MDPACCFLISTACALLVACQIGIDMVADEDHDRAQGTDKVFLFRDAEHSTQCT